MTIAVAEVGRFLAAEPSLEDVQFVCFEPRVTAAYESALRTMRSDVP